MIKLFTTILLTTLAFSKCSDNCLKCSAGSCLYCDLSQNYRLLDGQCQQYSVENCKIFNNFGTCLICADTYILDLVTQKCIKILQKDQIENCNLYNSPTTCSQCLAGFFLDLGKCSPITTPIKNCLYHNSQSLCIQCNAGFVLSIDQLSCIENPKISNCESYKNIECKTCVNGYFFEGNDYLGNIYSLATNSSQEDLLQRNNQLTSGFVDLRKFSTCIKITLQNCAKLYSFNFCEVCSTGYFRDPSGKCIIYPQDKFAYCKMYSSLTNCIECEEGYYLKDKVECVKIPSIPNCEKYSKFSGQTNCLECKETHFLIGFNNCVLRNNTKIVNCIKLQNDSEKCQTCQNTYRLTDDQNLCLTQISNCQFYEPSNYLTTVFICRICAKGFYYNKEQKTCIQGDKQFCEVFEKNENTCAQCQNKYYLEEGFCLPHEVIPSCQIYHPKIKNVCYSCNFDTFLFNKSNDCLATTEITNCEIYKEKNICAFCKDKYFLNSSGVCELIPAAENCERRTGNQCGKCLKDFILDDGVCRDPLDYIGNHCAKGNVDGFSDYLRETCFYCTLNKIPLNYIDTNICYENSYMKLIQNKTTLEPNCLVFQSDNDNNFTCSKCAFGFVVNLGTCVASCPSDKTLYKQILIPFNIDADRLNESYSVDKINQCGDLIKNCLIAAPNFNQPFQSKTEYSCLKCNPEKLPEITFGKNSHFVRQQNNEEKQFGESPVSFYPSLTCIDIQTNTSVLGEINQQTKKIDNCEYYLDLGLSKGCIKCNHGYAGVVKDVVDSCEVYTQNQYTCQTCKVNYYKISSYECRAVTEIINCTQYNSSANYSQCLQCSTNYYLSNNSCVQRNFSLNKTNCTGVFTSDSCTCNTEYFNVGTGSVFNCQQKPQNCLTAEKLANGNINCLECNRNISYKQNIGTISSPLYSCFLGTIANCKEYNETNPICNLCNEDYIVKEGNCVAHDSLTNCVKKHTTLKNTCIQCAPQSILFTYNTKCQSLATINNCIKYDTINTCEECSPGFRLDNLRTTCLEIPLDQNCLEQVPINIYDITGTTANTIDILDAIDKTLFLYSCLKCKPNFVKQEIQAIFNTTQQVTISGITQDHPRKNQQFPVIVCKPFLSTLYDSSVCQKSNVTGNTLLNVEKPTCLICNENYYPEFLNDNRYICLDLDYIKFKSPNKVFDNCQIVSYVLDGANRIYKCDLCNKDYALDNGICVQNCKTNYVKIVADYKIEGLLTIKNKTYDRICVSSTVGTVPNCKTYAKDIQSMGDDTKLICVECQTGFIRVVKYSTYDNQKFSKFNPYNNLYDLNSPVSKFYQIDKCLSPTTLIINGSLQENIVQGCAFYEEFIQSTPSVTSYNCIQCEIGKSGLVQKSGTNGGTFIQSCSAITSCYTANSLNINDNLGQFVKDINADQYPLQNLFSCFFCSGNQIPVLHAKIDGTAKTIVNLEPYDIDVTGTVKYNAGTSLNGNLVQCRQLYNSTDGAVLASSTDSFISDISSSLQLFEGKKGCGLAIMNTDSVKGAATVKCAACSPGYSPYRATPPTAPAFAFMDYCVVIQNCTTAGNWFNGCENCIHYYDYAASLAAQKPILDFQKCVQPREFVLTTSCFAAYYSGPCMICLKGYQKDQQGKCVTNTSPKCNSYSLQNNINILFTGLNGLQGTGELIPYLLEFDNIKGCSSCQTNFISTKIDSIETDRDTSFNPVICSENVYNPLRKIVTDCLRYGLKSPNTIPTNFTNQETLCKTCNNKILTTQNVCTTNDITTLNNCVLANEIDGTTCIECDSTKINVAGICYNPANLISNCQTYNLTESKIKPYPVCQTCNSGYYLSAQNKSCLTIPLSNCANWGLDSIRNKTWCLKCSTGYMLVEKKNEQQYCYPLSNLNGIDDNQNKCLEWDDVQFPNRILSCKKCNVDSNGHFLKVSTDIKKVTNCLAFDPLISNCASYDTAASPPPSSTSNIKGIFYNNTFKCLSCTQGASPDPAINYYYDANLGTCPSRNTVTNCLTHFTDQNKCQVCSQNFILENNECNVLKSEFEDQKPLNKGYIQKCNQLTDCDGNVQYEGLDLPLASISSCHKCIDSNQIPFVGVRLNNSYQIESLQEFGKPTDVTKKFIFLNGEKSNICLSPLKESFKITDSAQFVFPADCGLGLINTNSTPNSTDSSNATITNPETAKIGVFCAACAPKYKAVYTTYNGAKFSSMISSCTLISNCESSIWFNYCAQCNPNHSYKYVKDSGVKFDECISYTANPNCYAVDNSDSSNLKCKFCKVGYILNVDGYCEDLLAPRCSMFKFQFRQNYNTFDLGVGIWLSKQGLGCQQCDEGFVGLYNNNNKRACTISSFHVNSLVTTTSNYLFNCKNYKVNDSGIFECEQCNENFVLTVRGKCVPSSGVVNCVLALSETKCRKCAVGYVVVNRNCVANGIQNCQIFESNDQAWQQVCIKCKEGFFLRNNTCISGQISNCKEFLSEKVCVKCNDKFGLINTLGQNYCMPVADTLNCQEVDDEELKFGQFRCKSCMTNRFVQTFKEKEFFRNTCMNFVNKSNCAGYSKKEFLFASDFNCTSCEQDYFLTGQNCVARKKVENCLTYDPNGDKCLVCKDQFYLEADGLNCKPYPEGIPNCAIYSSKTVCQICNKDFYKFENICKKLLDSEKIANCIENETKTLCAKCDATSTLIDGKCVATAAQNCLTFESINACKTCKPDHGFALSEDSMFINCVQKNKPNCQISEDWTPYKCTKCDNGFYPDDTGNCIAVTPVIENCQYYNKDKKCEQCNLGFALSVDKSTCSGTVQVISLLDFNCSKSVIAEKPVCNTCAKGHVFRYGFCKACENNTANDGCVNCDPYDEKICLMCQSGYYMFDNGKCYKNGVVPEQQKPTETPQENPTQNNTNQNKTPTTGNVKIYIVSILLDFLLVLLVN